MSDQDRQARLRALPPVHELVAEAMRDERIVGIGRANAVDAARAVLDDERRVLTNGASTPATPGELVRRVVQHLHRSRRVLPTVINGTGVIVHTGLGRAPLAPEVAEAIARAASVYTPVEIDLVEGRRGHRSDVVRDDLCRLTGADSATIVNNAAAALVVTLATVAAERHVLVSRGELIEIGGSFRLPTIMAAGGAMLREVGTTNRTRASDFEDAIDETAAALLTVHTSNYRIEGFHEAASIESLAEIAARHRLPLIHDAGSGVLETWRELPGHDEPEIAASLQAGSDLVIFSGDKLLGGPQAGIIVGRADLIRRIEKHPLMRALRVDKLTLAGLSATLRLHLDGEAGRRRIPVHAMLRQRVGDLEERAARIVGALADIDDHAVVRPATSTAYIGGGSVPGRSLDSRAIVIDPHGPDEAGLAARLRAGDPAVMPRVHQGAVWIDLRTVFQEQDDALIKAIRSAAEAGAG